MDLPTWLIEYAWDDGLSIRELVMGGGGPEQFPVNKKEFTNVWMTRKRDAELLGNTELLVKAEGILKWLATASDGLMLVVFPKDRRSVLYDENCETALCI